MTWTVYFESRPCGNCGHVGSGSGVEFLAHDDVILKRVGVYLAIRQADGLPAEDVGEMAREALDKMRSAPAECAPVHEFGNERYAWEAFASTIGLLGVLDRLTKAYPGYVARVET